TRYLDGEKTFLILLNFKGESTSVNLSEVAIDNAKILLSNYNQELSISTHMPLKPWQCMLIQI
ncbi:MAG: hypothetical protein ACK5MJ_08015, partial [Alphaproteobacteria bacterium]